MCLCCLRNYKLDRRFLAPLNLRRRASLESEGMALKSCTWKSLGHRIGGDVSGALVLDFDQPGFDALSQVPFVKEMMFHAL